VTDVRAIHKSGFERIEGDFYPTPAWVTECLLANVTLRGPIWEPCCGDGAIAKVLTAAGHEVEATDLVDRGFGSAGTDFFTTSRMPEGCRTLVTNPPYGDGGFRGRAGKAAAHMLGFVEHAIRLTREAQGQLALLVRFRWIAGKRVASLLTEARMHSRSSLPVVSAGSTTATTRRGSTIMRGSSSTSRCPRSERLRWYLPMDLTHNGTIAHLSTKACCPCSDGLRPTRMAELVA
jgi:hypothetical protein